MHTPSIFSKLCNSSRTSTDSGFTSGFTKDNGTDTGSIASGGAIIPVSTIRDIVTKYIPTGNPPTLWRSKMDQDPITGKKMKTDIELFFEQYQSLIETQTDPSERTRMESDFENFKSGLFWPLGKSKDEIRGHDRQWQDEHNNSWAQYNYDRMQLMLEDKLPENIAINAKTDEEQKASIRAIFASIHSRKAPDPTGGEIIPENWSTLDNAAQADHIGRIKSEVGFTRLRPIVLSHHPPQSQGTETEPYSQYNKKECPALKLSPRRGGSSGATNPLYIHDTSGPSARLNFYRSEKAYRDPYKVELPLRTLSLASERIGHFFSRQTFIELTDEQKVSLATDLLVQFYDDFTTSQPVSDDPSSQMYKDTQNWRSGLHHELNSQVGKSLHDRLSDCHGT
ncbi:uncharacterized protein I303_103412 [Kwoniella dejecticola CBS 10117]|uniref:Uncharacterized protein n=1 Tax=Kwoniella dejecticola CBS 10117 TaxID=1296121 RepID=A0A1A6A6P7_9TREE|nr:uncharacterized protein I303_03434 [Kwoniella dejecticola CBS 10117]OBR85723.1 hypothetical protein I303_03434 [Kwoniella dejecticola CBS 10117]